MSSKLYDELVARIKVLDARYLPVEADVLGEYSDAQRDDARAFVVLSHAAIEEYLESLSLLLSTEVDRRASAGHYDELVCTFLSFWSTTVRGKKSKPSCLSDLAHAAASFHRKTVGGNHGIKAKDLDHLFEPFCVPGVCLPPDFEAALDSFGMRRGECAHTGLVGANVRIDPYEMHSTVKELMQYLADFDSWVEGLLAEAEACTPKAADMTASL